ncbi:MAG: hypothetical protein OXG25_00095 [Gammaproteobacteria bacterium]|nr:hypothetical protein [Gammaproteobacteria bacterium]
MADPADVNRGEIAIDKSIAYIVYVLFIIGYLAGGVAVLVGVVLAYLARRRAREHLLVSHYSWQIQIFWWSFATFAVAITVMLLLIYTLVFWLLGVVIGVLSILVITITVLVLAIRGMLDLSNNKLAK